MPRWLDSIREFIFHLLFCPGQPRVSCSKLYGQNLLITWCILANKHSVKSRHVHTRKGYTEPPNKLDHISSRLSSSQRLKCILLQWRCTVTEKCTFQRGRPFLGRSFIGGSMQCVIVNSLPCTCQQAVIGENLLLSNIGTIALLSVYTTWAKGWSWVFG